MALIPAEELKFLLETVDEAKPWNTPAYKIEMFLRRYYCTLLSAFLAVAVLDHPWDFVFIAVAFILEVTVSWRSYDMTMSGKEVVRLMYCPTNATATNPEYKKYFRLFYWCFILFFLLHMAAQYEQIPFALLQRAALLTMPVLCIYSSLKCVRLKYTYGIFYEADSYEKIGNHISGINSPSIFGLISLIPNPDWRNGIFSFVSTILGGLLSFGLFAFVLHDKWPVKTMLMAIIIAAPPLFMTLLGILKIPTGCFLMKCYFIDQYRLHNFREDKL